ncbi:MAG TPA: hypothetical protein PLF54_06800 [Deltaproteobacteria bacterium]|nr:hypothetical protein [Deltaproteobacteria bacterium]HQJ08694.1 hypothetical protein [Deltaproteobacteria bacterium]
MSESAVSEKTTRCSMLGHQVPFEYCRQCSNSLPCRKIIDCWSHEIDVRRYLEKKYTPEEIRQILSPPKPKLLQIIEIAKKASARGG